MAGDEASSSSAKPSGETSNAEDQSARAHGNDAYRRSEFQEAVDFYTEAIAEDSGDHTLLSNRSAAYACLGRNEEALEDAKSCVKLEPAFVKGYARLGLALFHLNRLEDSRDAYKQGLEKDSSSAFLLDGLKKVEDKIKGTKWRQDHQKRSRAQRLMNPLGLSCRGMFIYVVLVAAVCGAVVYYKNPSMHSDFSSSSTATKRTKPTGDTTKTKIRPRPRPRSGEL